MAGNRDRDVVVVGLDAKDFRGDARSFAERFGLTFPLVYDGPGDTLDGYGMTGFPETFVSTARDVWCERSPVRSRRGPRPKLLAAIERALET